MWGKPPARLVMFRDGLSEGEWEGVGALEIAAIEGVFQMKSSRPGFLNLVLGSIKELWAERRLSTAKPKLTYIVVGKR